MKLTERDFTATVIELAQWAGWKTAHFRPCQTEGGQWRTAVQGDGVGWPDLVLVKDQRIIFAELKSERGRMTGEQVAWLFTLLELPPPVEVYTWRPKDMGRIRELLGVPA